MSQDTAGPEGAAKAIAASKKLMEGWKGGPLGTKSGHLEGPKPPQVHSDAASASYQAARNARKAADEPSKIVPAGDTSGQELKQAEENANQLREAAKPQP